LRGKTYFTSHFNLLRAFKAKVENISLFPKKELCLSSTRPHPQEGRYAIVTSVGCGMRWTFRLKRALARGRMSSKRTAKPCGPGTPTLVSSFAVMIRKAMVANKPGTPGRARSSR
jgi:hypothetical protein